MDQVGWRKKVRCAGYLDLVLSGIHVLAAGLITLGAITVTLAAVCTSTSPNSPEVSNLKPEVKEAILMTVPFAWILALLSILSAFIQVLAGVRLLNSTEIGRQPADALRDAKFWRSVAITLMMIFAAIGVGLGEFPMVLLGTVVWLGFRGAFVIYVWKFMGQLEAECMTIAENKMTGKGKI